VLQLTDKEFSSLFFSLLTHFYCFREIAGYSLMVFVFVHTCTHLCGGGAEEWEGNVLYRYVPGHTKITCNKLQLREAGLKWIKSILTEHEVHMLLDDPFFCQWGIIDFGSIWVLHKKYGQ